MAHHNYLATIQFPVRSNGCNIENRYGMVIASASSTFMADAIAETMNWGIDGAEAHELAYQAKESALRDMLLSHFRHSGVEK